MDGIYERYCKLRDAVGVKDADVAKATGIGRSTFSDWKNGRSVPKRQKLEKIAAFLGVDIDYFYDVQTSGHNDGYYVYGETAEVAQEIFENKDMRILFSAARDSRPEDLRMAAELLMRFKQTNPDG